MRSHSIEIPCGHCGKPFTLPPSQYQRGVRCCSTACAGMLRRTGLEVPCLQCGKSFHVPPCDLRAGRRKFCSRACYILGRFNGSDRRCPRCGKSFYVTPARAAEGRGIYCGTACADAAKVIVTDPVAFYHAHVVKGPGCWGWTGRSCKGYGTVASRGQVFLAHRLSWEIHNGPIPPGLCVLHSCDNPPCSNPAHLFLGTQTDNNRDRDRKGRKSVGSRSPRAKLTEELLFGLRQRYARGEINRWTGTSIIDLARSLGMNEGNLSNALRGKTWKHVPMP